MRNAAGSRMSAVGLVGLVCAGAAWGGYTYDYVELTDNPNYSQVYGTWDYSIGAFVTFPSSGSMALIPAISEPNPNDYEVNSTLGLKSGYGTYINFMRASSTSVVAGSGSYIRRRS